MTDIPDGEEREGNPGSIDLYCGVCDLPIVCPVAIRYTPFIDEDGDFSIYVKPDVDPSPMVDHLVLEHGVLDAMDIRVEKPET